MLVPILQLFCWCQKCTPYLAP